MTEDAGWVRGFPTACWIRAAIDCVSVGIHYDTAQFAVASIHQWWMRMGGAAYPQAQELLITADAGGQPYRPSCGNGSSLAVRNGSGDHGRSLSARNQKWNKIEHRMFGQSRKLAGPTVEILDVIVNRISTTTTRTGLVIHVDWDIRLRRESRLQGRDDQVHEARQFSRGMELHHRP